MLYIICHKHCLYCAHVVLSTFVRTLLSYEKISLVATSVHILHFANFENMIESRNLGPLPRTSSRTSVVLEKLDQTYILTCLLPEYGNNDAGLKTTSWNTGAVRGSACAYA